MSKPRVICADCGGRMELNSTRKRYKCKTPGCRAQHAAFRDGSPVGKPGDKAARLARGKAHRVFDFLWKSGVMGRRTAYRWLREKMGMRDHQCHIGKFTEAQCLQVIEHVTKLLGKSSCRLTSTTQTAKTKGVNFTASRPSIQPAAATVAAATASKTAATPTKAAG